MLVVIALAPLLAAGGSPDLEKILQGPRSPARLAALVEFGSDPRVSTALAEGLLDPRAGVRSAAARVACVLGLKALAGDMASALARETDIDATVEETRAVAVLGESAELAVIPEAVKGRSQLTQEVAAYALARRLGLRALTDVKGLWDLELPKGETYVRALSRGEVDAVRGLVVLCLSRERPDLLGAALAVLRDPMTSVNPGVVVAGLSSSSSRIRAQFLWDRAARPLSEMTAEQLEAADAAPEARGEGGDPEAALAYELLSRRRGQPPREASAALEAAYQDRGPRTPVDRGWTANVVALLVGREKSVLLKALYGEWDGPEKPELHAKYGEPFVPSEGQRFTMQTLELPEGLATDVLRLFGCKGNDSPMFGAGIAFGLDGRPRRTKLLGAGPRPDACERATRVLLLNALVPHDQDPKQAQDEQLLLLPLAPSFLSCRSRSTRSPHSPDITEGRRRGSRIKEPRKLKNVPPVYPEAAKRAGVKGVVRVEAQIAASGCIASMRVLESPDPRLSWEAMRAIGAWQYSSTLVGDVPVPVLMTVTVNFRLP